MAIFYKLRYRDSKINPDAKGYYAFVANKGLVDTDAVAEEIQRNCSMKRSDVLAVLAELSEVLKQNIQQSHSVKLDGIGVFRPGISSKMSPSAQSFNVHNNIKQLRLNFLPEQVVQGKVRIKKVFVGASLSMEGGIKVENGGGVQQEDTGQHKDPGGTSPNPEFSGGKDAGVTDTASSSDPVKK